ncbi:MAG: hypothetical protein K8I27_16600 [Planctomycetes bacterium]|nr:hypothetical protein [Planctomycetota bacterium]
MRFLNRKWVEGGYDGFTTDLYWGVYLRHFEDIAADLPKMARALGSLSLGKGLTGSQVTATSLDRDARSFRLVLKVQTIEGDAYLEIAYRGVDPDAVDEHMFDAVDFILTDELDIAPGDCFEHRVLLSPEGEFAIQFNDMDIKLARPGEDE